jgi:polysaccharide deacetylase family protein (PEP-CTERM system associated)
LTGLDTVEHSLRRDDVAAGVGGPQLAEPTPRTFVLSIDFEDWHQLVHRRIGRPDWEEGSATFERHVSTLLDLLDELGVRATFFVAGITADRHPGALAAVAARGHELACHGYDHRRAFRQTPDEFRQDVLRSVDAVQRIGGVTPAGYRAPWFSITRDSFWAHDVLRDLGFSYDSSLFDSPRIPNRIQPIPARPWRLGNDRDGLWEFPIAVWRRGRIVLPLGGGAYWRALPEFVLWRGLEQVSRNGTFPVLYFHPYEFAREPLRAVLATAAGRRERVRETWRDVSKNTRRHLIPPRLREAARRFRLVPFCAVLHTNSDDLDETLLRQARARV